MGHSEKVCRICLIKPPVYFSLLENHVAPMLEALAFTQVSPHDEISTIICLKCFLNLKLTYNFLKKWKDSERKLYENVIVKQEAPQESGDLVEICYKNCPICGHRDTSLNDHIRDHFTNAQNCTICGESFKDIPSYKEHLRRNPRIRIHECKNCRGTFQYKTFYDVHVRTVCSLDVSSKKTKLPVFQDERVMKLGVTSTKAIEVLLGSEDHECEVCLKKIAAKSFHNHSHATETCGICKKEVTKSNYKKHVKDHIVGVQVCHLCGAKLQNKNSLRSHIFYLHNGHRYKCEECGKVFQKKGAMNLHKLTEHLGSPTHCCETCGKGFFTNRFLEKHIKMKHLKLRPFICQYCNKSYSSQYSLKTHIRMHTNETPYKCEVCGEGFRLNVSLRAHLKSKHSIVEETNFFCEVCGRGFASKAALHVHRRRHE